MRKPENIPFVCVRINMTNPEPGDGAPSETPCHFDPEKLA